MQKVDTFKSVLINSMAVIGLYWPPSLRRIFGSGVEGE